MRDSEATVSFRIRTIGLFCATLIYGFWALGSNYAQTTEAPSLWRVFSDKSWGEAYDLRLLNTSDGFKIQALKGNSDHFQKEYDWAGSSVAGVQKVEDSDIFSMKGRDNPLIAGIHVGSRYENGAWEICLDAAASTTNGLEVLGTSRHPISDPLLLAVSDGAVVFWLNRKDGRDQLEARYLDKAGNPSKKKMAWLLEGQGMERPAGLWTSQGLVVVWPAKFSRVFGLEGVLFGDDLIFADDFESNNLEAWTEVDAPPLAFFTATPESGTAPQWVSFDASESIDYSGEIVSHDWDLGDGTFGQGIEFSHLYEDVGDMTVSLTVTSSTGLRNTVSSIVPIHPPNQAPTADFVWTPQEGHAPLIVQFDATSSSDPEGPIERYEWSWGDGSFGEGALAEHTFEAVGEYEVVLTVLDSVGDEDSISGMVSVSPQNQTPTAEMVLTPSEGIAPIDVTLDASGSSDPDGDIVSYLWDLGDGTVAEGAVISHTYQTGGILRPRLRIVDDDGAESVATALLLATPSPVGVIETSPMDGETNIALTRESVLYFDGALDLSTVTASTIYASFSGEILSTSIHVSPDGRKVTLFYQEPLPAASRISIFVEGDLIHDHLGRPVDADRDGESGGRGELTFDTLGLTPVAGTEVCGWVFASEQADGSDVPLPDVSIAIDVGDGSTQTAQDGRFCLNPAPAGRFFVHVDGRTSTADVPPGAFYPYVGKAWESIPGDRVEVGSVFLPLIAPGTLQDVSLESDTLVTFPPVVLEQQPELEGVELTVPADSLFSEDGSRGGQVGIAPVAPDRLPGPLPDGFDPPLVITVQTDGATNFDRPAPICFPNLPSSETGEPLPPGSSSALVSFDHDRGEWAVIGPMSVRPEGDLVCTDPGVGIEAPGWHFSWPLMRVQGERVVGPRLFPEPDPPAECPEDGFNECPIADVRVTIRSFIPSPAVLYPNPLSPALFGGDSRGFSVNSNAFRGEQEAILSTDPSLEGGLVIPPPPWGLTERFGLGSGLHVAAKPWWWWSLFPTAAPIAWGVLASNDYTNKIEVYPLRHGAKGIFTFNGGNPLTPSPALNSRIYVDLAASPDGAMCRVYGAHDGFPAYEVYIDGVPFRQFDPVAESESPLSLAWPMEHFFDSSWVPCSQAQPVPAPLERREKSELPERYVDHLYAILDLERNVVVQRGVSPNGIAVRPVVLQARRAYRLLLFAPADGYLGYADFGPSQAGDSVSLGKVEVFDGLERDFDRDGLVGTAELILGTDPTDPDTDGDGISDGAEAGQGINPLDDYFHEAGIIGSVETLGEPEDLCALDGTVAVADGSGGVLLLDVTDPSNPVTTAQLATSGQAEGIACAPGLVAVAQGPHGIALIDIGDPTNPSIYREISSTTLGSSATSVALADDQVFVGTQAGEVLSVDAISGTILTRVTQNGGRVTDLSLGREQLYVLAGSGLSTIHIGNGLFDHRSYRAIPVSSSDMIGNLFAGDDILYVTQKEGYTTFDLSDPDFPEFINEGHQSNERWAALSVSASGLGVAAKGIEGESTDIALYDVTDPTETNTQLGIISTPGTTRAITLYGGLAYVADTEGLHVLLYRPFDAGEVAPSLELEPSFNTSAAEEGKWYWIGASSEDDGEIRDVTFFRDGEKLVEDGNYPYGMRLQIPFREQQSSFVLEARASDTGGNTVWSDPLVVSIASDSNSPSVSRVAPTGETYGGVGTVAIFFSESMDESSFTESTVSVSDLGPDGLPGTADDESVEGAITFDDQATSVFFRVSPTLSLGRYRARLEIGAMDLSGNTLEEAMEWYFEIKPTVVPKGPAFNVNTATVGDQHLPAVAGGEDGRFIVVWWDGHERELQSRVFNSEGLPFSTEANSLPLKLDGAGKASGCDSCKTYIPATPKVDRNSSGETVVVFGDALILDPDGVQVGDEISVPGVHLDVGIDDAGSFVVISQEEKTRVEYEPLREFIWRELIARRFDSMGLPVGTEILVTSGPEHFCGLSCSGVDTPPFGAAIDSNSKGEFIVVWGSNPALPGWRHFNEFGVPITDSMQLPEDVSGINTISRGPDVQLEENGDFVVSWRSLIFGDARLQKFARSGMPLTETISVAIGGYGSPDIAQNTPGEFLVVWGPWQGGGFAPGQNDGGAKSSSPPDGRYLSGMLQPLGSPMDIGPIEWTEPEDRPVAAGIGDTDFVVVWTTHDWEGGGVDPSGYGIRARIVGPDR